jgi:hypothetical protein
MVIEKKSEKQEQDQAQREEMGFRVAARRNKLLGLWLAGELGVADAEAYAKEVVISDLDEPGDEDVIRKVMADIAEHGSAITEDQIRGKLAEFLLQAQDQ